MRKFGVIAILLILLIATGLYFRGKETEKVGLIPLDSRPCNTQYPQLLGNMTNKDIIIPYDNLDDFLKPAPTNKLWEWLESNINSLDTIIIFTNELFNGGLIASRHEYTYGNYNENLTRLKTLCQKNKDKNIVIVSVLPRLLPSQFSELWKYQKELVDYAKLLDRHALQDKEIPLPPQKVPVDVLNKYLNIYNSTEDIVKAIISMTNEGLVDHYLIGQDDAQEYGLSNKIVREISPLLNEKIQFVHGADELTMLTLIRPSAQKFTEGIQLKYANEELQNEFFPFEAAPLEKVISTKTAYLNIALNDASPYLEIVYNDTTKITSLQNTVRESKYNYLGIMDVAHTNKGDTALLDMINSETDFHRQLNGYAGWNTAGNTIGTELAYLVSHSYLENQPTKYTKTNKIKALEAMIKFKYIRIAEDLIYQGILREKLIKKIREEEIDPYNLGNYAEKAELILTEMYEPYANELNKLFTGKYKVGNTTFTVDKIDSRIELPWARTFEAKIIPEVNVSIK